MGPAQGWWVVILECLLLICFVNSNASTTHNLFHHPHATRPNNNKTCNHFFLLSDGIPSRTRRAAAGNGRAQTFGVASRTRRALRQLAEPPHPVRVSLPLPLLDLGGSAHPLLLLLAPPAPHPRERASPGEPPCHDAAPWPEPDKMGTLPKPREARGPPEPSFQNPLQFDPQILTINFWS